MKIRTSLIASTAAMFLTAVSWGGTIAITNPDFESPVCGTQTTTPLACGAPTGWTQGGNDLAAAFLPATTDTLQADSGLQYAYTQGGAFLDQVLAATLQANTTYTFEVAVGNRTNPTNTGFCQLCVFDPQMEIIDANTNAILGTASGSTPAVGAWTDWTATFSTGSVGVGDSLEIVLFTAGANQGDFDLVEGSSNATVSGVPEPSTFMFAGAGLLGLGFAARRRMAAK
jgi:hypothetical protein